MATRDQAVRLATADEIRLYARQGWTCARCTDPIGHVTSYKFVTGRSGRVGQREMKVCAAHAAKFAANHGLPMPRHGDGV